jgi:hypothetical protein
MDPAYVSAMAALSGSVVGGVTSLAASWLSQSAQVRANQLVQDKSRRQDLYKAFIEEASRIFAHALANNAAEIASLVNLYAMISRMRILSSPAVIQHADALVRLIIDTYFEPNVTLRELRDAVEGNRFDPIRQFSEACREDLSRSQRI